jgi:cytochrome c5
MVVVSKYANKYSRSVSICLIALVPSGVALLRPRAEGDLAAANDTRSDHYHAVGVAPEGPVQSGNLSRKPWSEADAKRVVERGKELFARQCAVCHGETGDGAGKFAYVMNPRPRNLQQGNFKIASTEDQVPTQEGLIRTISRGMPGSAMPPWGHLQGQHA